MGSSGTQLQDQHPGLNFSLCSTKGDCPTVAKWSVKIQRGVKAVLWVASGKGGSLQSLELSRSSLFLILCFYQVYSEQHFHSRVPDAHPGGTGAAGGGHGGTYPGARGEQEGCWCCK